MKKLSFVLILMFFLNFVYGRTLNSRVKAVAIKGDAAFEWKQENGIPEKVLGLGKIISCTISNNKKYFILNTSTGIEVYNYKNCRFIKKLMLKEKAIRISFAKKAKYVFYKLKSGGIYKWGIFNFSFVKVSQFPAQISKTVDFKVKGYTVFIGNNRKKSFIRRNPYFYRFALENNRYLASGDENGVIYEFVEEANDYIRDRIYNTNGKIVDLSFNKKFALIKKAKHYEIFNLNKNGRVIRRFKSDYSYFLPRRGYNLISSSKNILLLKNLRGRVLRRKRFKGKIKFLSVTKYGISLIAKKLYILDFNFRIKSFKDGNFRKCYSTKSGYVYLKEIRPNRFEIFETKKNKTKRIAKIRNTSLKHVNGMFYFKWKNGLKIKRSNKIVFIPKAKTAFYLFGKLFVIKNNVLFIYKRTKLFSCHLKIKGNVFVSNNKLYFNSKSALHHVMLKRKHLKLLLSLKPKFFILKAKKYIDNDFARNIEYVNMLEYFPNNLKSIKEVGSFFLKQKKYANALEYFTKLKKLGYKKPDLYKGIGLSYFKLRKYKKAVRNLSIALRKHRRDARLHYYLGTSYFYLKAYGLSIRHLRTSIKLNKKFMKSYVNLAVVYKKIRRTRDEERLYLSALTINEASHIVYFNLGLFYERVIKLPLALLCYKKALSIKPKDEIYAYQVSQAYIKMKRWDKSLKFLKLTVRLNPENAPAQYNLGWIYEKQKNNNTLARYHYRMHIQLRPNSCYKRRIIRFLRRR